MNTPKQEAKTLYSRYKEFTYCIGISQQLWHQRTKQFITCIVNDLIGAVSAMEDPTLFIDGEWNHAVEYWTKIKEEIEKLKID